MLCRIPHPPLQCRLQGIGTLFVIFVAEGDTRMHFVFPTPIVLHIAHFNLGIGTKAKGQGEGGREDGRINNRRAQIHPRDPKKGGKCTPHSHLG